MDLLDHLVVKGLYLDPDSEVGPNLDPEYLKSFFTPSTYQLWKYCWKSLLKNNLISEKRLFLNNSTRSLSEGEKYIYSRMFCWGGLSSNTVFCHSIESQSLTFAFPFFDCVDPNPFLECSPNVAKYRSNLDLDPQHWFKVKIGTVDT